MPSSEITNFSLGCIWVHDNFMSLYVIFGRNILISFCKLKQRGIYYSAYVQWIETCDDESLVEVSRLYEFCYNATGNKYTMRVPKNKPLFTMSISCKETWKSVDLCESWHQTIHKPKSRKNQVMKVKRFLKLSSPAIQFFSITKDVWHLYFATRTATKIIRYLSPR